MDTQMSKKMAGAGAERRFHAGAAVIALLLLPVALAAGCTESFNQKFGQAALGPIETGVKSILDGVVSGIFAGNHGSSSSSASTNSSSPNSPSGSTNGSGSTGSSGH